MKTKTVYVKSAQKQAAKALVTRSARTGRFVSSAVTKIANAESASAARPRSGVPNTTVAAEAPPAR